MGVLQRFERRLGGLVEGGFARVFRGRVEPVELAGALAREADNNKAVGPARVLVPNLYNVDLGRSDFERLAPYSLTLGDELAVMLSEHAVEQGYSFVGPVSVTLRQQDALGTGSFRIDSRVEAGPEAPNDPVMRTRPRPEPYFPPLRTGLDASSNPVGPLPVPPPPLGEPPVVPPVPAPRAEPEPIPAAVPAPDPSVTTVLRAEEPPPPPPAYGQLELPSGERVTLRSETTVIGRGADCDVRVVDASVSRRHARLTVVGRAVVVEDLGSTNGTLLNGKKVGRETLGNGDELRFGAAVVRFWS